MNTTQKAFIAKKQREYRRGSGHIVRTANDLTCLDYERYQALGGRQ